ncbi:uncharacterized protein B0H18DRAFT_1113844 [Fomitopsis serialis]|uniref:uncharacterized protein n=1 Tax=Fomitopsis serialis TaxID=139415 RepID=UPI0020073F9E|nr:uncharacterized protein B0H18DRAFT_1113829 [Neoantrodia serialis]XP_047899824.1 uncharacterized protein B0H18DRAFT_1113844 [Neoantrodia serialis]KAH9936444.1 hypothetical protein B0H18DRAFT_1113829 [Neoantrodia serialis]KAH9936460.1 hypothetical protein B0H18DRAFT_1113844 [Neoantrodia serialis]
MTLPRAYQGPLLEAVVRRQRGAFRDQPSRHVYRSGGEANDVEVFCAVVGNEGEAFKTARTDRNEAPMDFAIVTGWQATMKAIFPATIDDDLLKPAHLTCGFRRC